MSCEHALEQLDDFLDGQLDPGASRAFLDHVDTCTGCSATLREAQAIRQALRDLPAADLPEDFADRVLANAQRHTSDGRFSRYRALTAGGVAASLAAIVALTMLTGEPVRPPVTEHAGGLASIEMSLHETRTVTLVFNSSATVDNVSLIIDLPRGIELSGYPGRERVRWTTRLTAGRNLLPLELVASEPLSGQLHARLDLAEEQTVFAVDIAVRS